MDIDHENILVEWADKAMCYKWLHAKSNIKTLLEFMVHYSRNYYEYPTGTANLLKKIPEITESMLRWLLGRLILRLVSLVLFNSF